MCIALPFQKGKDGLGGGQTSGYDCAVAHHNGATPNHLPPTKSHWALPLRPEVRVRDRVWIHALLRGTGIAPTPASYPFFRPRGSLSYAEASPKTPRSLARPSSLHITLMGASCTEGAQPRITKHCPNSSKSRHRISSTILQTSKLLVGCLL